MENNLISEECCRMLGACRDGHSEVKNDQRNCRGFNSKLHCQGNLEKVKHQQAPSEQAVLKKQLL
jgi:hypothetical protein